MIFAVDAIVCFGLGLLSHFFHQKTKLISLEILGALILLFFIFFFLTDMGKTLQYFAVTSFAKVTAHNTDVTALALYISFGLIWILFLFEIVIQSHIVPFLIILTWTLCSPLFGIEIGVLSMMCMVLFQTAFFVINMVNIGSAKIYFSVSVHSALSRQNLLAITSAFLAALAIAAPIVSNNTEPLYTVVDNAESYIYQFLNTLTGISSNSIISGKINTGNLYQTGIPEMEIQLDHAPIETLYLRNFIGGNYIGNEWEKCQDEHILHQLYIYNQDSTSYNRVLDFFSIKNILTAADSSDTGLFNTLTVTPLNTTHFINIDSIDTYYSHRLSESTLQYYPRSTFSLDLSKAILSNSAWIIESFQEIQNSYMQAIQFAYTSYPKEILPRLKALCAETPLSSLDEVTAFIVYTLSTNASYTTTPGTANRNQDIIEYFLFENHKGYCVHYASTAALIYRMYGIPARYVSGYAVPSFDFQQQADNTYTATVSDKQAHAWTEIYLKNYGWVPVDFTPSDTGMISAVYPGFTYIDMLNILNQHGWKLPTMTQSESSSTSDDSEGTNTPNNIQTVITAILLSCAAIIFIIIILIQRRKAQIKALHTCNIRRTFDMLIDLLHFTGAMKGYNGTETDFIPKLCDALPYLSRGDIERFIEILEKRAYGGQGVSKEEVYFIKSIYQTVSEQTYTQLGIIKRLIFRYIKGFI